MAPPYCEKRKQRCHTKTREKQSHTYKIRLRPTNQERNQQPCKMTPILLLPASRHGKHDTHIKTRHTTHPAPDAMSTTTHHSSRSTAAPMSSLTTLPPHCYSAMIVVAPLLRCEIQSAVAALGLDALSYQPSIHHFPTRVPRTTCPPTSLLLA